MVGTLSSGDVEDEGANNSLVTRMIAITHIATLHLVDLYCTGYFAAIYIALSYGSLNMAYWLNSSQFVVNDCDFCSLTHALLHTICGR